MKLFLISAQDEFEAKAEILIRENYGDRNLRLHSRQSPLWVVAAPSENTPASVAESMNMTDTKNSEERVSGMVVQLRDYFGYDSMAIWQQFETWSNE